MIFGRGDELACLDRLLADARSGRGGSLVIGGEAGIGKTVLLDHAATVAADMRVLRGVGIESEAELPFAGLHLLLYPYMDRLEALPGPQAAALRTAFGLAEASVRDRFLVGAATLSLLSELAGDSPLVCLIDDAQWFDQASLDALLFAVRRLHADPAAVVFAVRDGAGHFPASGIQVLSLTALDRDSAAVLLAQHAHHGLSDPVRERILAEARGNPLAVIEFAATLSAMRDSDGSASRVPFGPLPVAGRVQDAFRAQIAGLPTATQLLLLLAAADDTASLAVILRAGDRLGVSASDLEPAERARLIVLTGETIAFRHPLIRAAAYQDAPHGRLITVHQALARTLTTEQDADRRAWHLAAATAGPDEAVAVELEQAARRAEQRGGATAVATALERAAQLSTDQARRAERLVGAARAAYDAGRLDRANEFAAQGASLAQAPAVLADAAWIRAQVAYERDCPAVAAALALEGAAPIIDSHPEQAVSILTDAVGCAKDACDHDLVRRCAEQLKAVTLNPESGLRPVIEGLIGLSDLIDGATPQAITAMRALVQAAQSGDIDGTVERVLAGYMGLMVADDEAATDVLESLVADLRRQGSLGWLPYAQEPLAIAQLLSGRFRDAETTVTEALSVSADIGQQTQLVILNAIPAWLAAVGADASRCRSLADGILQHAARHPTNAALADWALGLLDLAQGRFDAAFDRLDTVCAGPARHDFLIRAIPDHVEAAVRSERTAEAGRYLAALDNWAEHTGRPFAAALSRRCHALLGPGHDAETHYDAALRLHQDDQRPFDRARTQLLYAEWLRRQRRRSDARAQLTHALDAFERLGATDWADRTRTELTVLGDRPMARPHDANPLARLTPQELQVVRLAAAGLSNREIAAQLFLSPRTVGHHLYRAYPKLGVAKRMELAQLSL